MSWSDQPRAAFVTGSLHVDYLKPTPLDGALELRGRIVEIQGPQGGGRDRCDRRRRSPRAAGLVAVEMLGRSLAAPGRREGLCCGAFRSAAASLKRCAPRARTLLAAWLRIQGKLQCGRRYTLCMAARLAVLNDSSSVPPIWR
ncbi:MAG: hypothetical protein MZV49_11050 [Rhodopseudomonas palustris]|nr:hypothetical protein [Rhodopseudomonas palustris]